MSAKASAKSIWDFRRGIATARVLTQLGFDHGVSVDNMLRHTGITRALLDDPKGEIEAHQEVQLARNLINALPHIPTLGLQAGTRYHVTTYGLWGYAVMSSPTLGSAVSMASRMLNLTFSLTINEIEQIGDLIQSSFHCDHLPPDVRQFILDRDRAAVITLQREILGRPLPYRAVHMRRQEPSPEIVEAYTSLFGIRPTFGQARDCALFDVAIMQERLPQADPHTAALCEQMCRKLVDTRKTRTGVAASVRDRLLRTPGHIPDMEEIASEMKITSRTLRRHLTAEGATFRALLEEVRSTLAEELMSSASLTHGEIAVLGLTRHTLEESQHIIRRAYIKTYLLYERGGYVGCRMLPEGCKPVPFCQYGTIVDVNHNWCTTGSPRNAYGIENVAHHFNDVAGQCAYGQLDQPTRRPVRAQIRTHHQAERWIHRRTLQ